MKKLVLILVIGVVSLSLKGQFLDNRIDFGFGAGFHLPLNSENISEYSSFRYPSLYGNYAFGAGIQAFCDYHIAKSLRVGIELESSRYNPWKGNQDVFILNEPVLSLSSISLRGLYLPQKKVQFASPATNWGYYIAPVFTYQLLKWDDTVLENNNQPAFSHSTIHPGFKTGFSLFHEFNNYYGLRLDVYYHFSLVESPYYLDKSFQSVNVSLNLFTKRFHNKYFRYD